MSARSNRPLVVAASRMSGVRAYIDVEPDALAAALRPLGPVGLLGPPKRQLCCELWRVTHPRVLIGGLEQSDWTSVARSIGEVAGSFWGGKVARSWGSFLALRAEAATRWTVIEPYHELLVSVPDVRYPGCAEPVSVALGMATDLPLAVRLDRLAYYGYNKCLADFSTDGRHEWEVSIDGTPFLQASFEPTGRTAEDFDRGAAGSGGLQPLLGGLVEGRPMIAELRRDLVESGDNLHEVEGTLSVHQSRFPLMKPGDHPVTSSDAPDTRISVGFRDAETHVTYPRPPDRTLP